MVEFQYLSISICLGVSYFALCYLFLYVLYWKLPRILLMRFVFRIFVLGTIIYWEFKGWLWANDHFGPISENLRFAFLGIWLLFAIASFFQLARLGQVKQAALDES